MTRRLALLLSTTLLYLISIYPGSAQTFDRQLMIGATSGVNISNMIFSPNIQQGYKVGYDAGVVLRYDVGYVYDIKNVVGSIWVEVDYSNRGWREEPKDLEAPYNKENLYYDRILTYISVPVMTQLSFGQKALKLTVFMGTQFGYLLSERSESNYPDTKIPGVITVQHDMPVEHKLAWGIGGGLGTEYRINKKIVAGLKATYIYGLGEIYGNSMSDFFGKSSEQVLSTKAYLLLAF